MNQFDRLLEQARNKALKKRLNAVSSETPSTFVREKSSTEENSVYTPPGFGILFCPHSKSYFDVCSACKRDKERAQQEFELFCRRRGIKP
jgi:hypothetical protein